jgi:hypothetical protein
MKVFSNSLPYNQAYGRALFALALEHNLNRSRSHPVAQPAYRRWFPVWLTFNASSLFFIGFTTRDTRAKIPSLQFRHDCQYTLRRERHQWGHLSINQYRTLRRIAGIEAPALNRYLTTRNPGPRVNPQNFPSFIHL